MASRRTGTIQGRILELLSDGRQRTAASIALSLGEGADTVARELRKLRSGRRFVGVELKDSYFRQAVANLEAEDRQERLFA